MTSPSGTTEPGQAPGSGGNSGQAPQVNNSGSPSAAPAGQAPTGNMSAVDAEHVIAELRKENASTRTKLKAFEDAQAAADMAKLGDLEKAQKRLAEVEQQATTVQRELLDLKITRAIERKAAELGIIDPDAAAKLIDWADMEFDDKGLPKNLDTMLSALLAAKPYLFAQASGTQPPRPASSGGATNPGAGGVAPGAGAGSGATITRSSYAAMSQQERISRNKEVQDVLKRYGGRLPD